MDDVTGAMEELAAAKTHIEAAMAKLQPTASLTVSPQAIVVGDSAVLTWQSTNGVSATLNGAAVPLAGTMTVTPTTNTTYTLIVTGAHGTQKATSSVTVAVTQPPPPPPVNPSISTLTVFPSSVMSGDPVTVAWATQNAITATLNGITVGVAGSQVFSPTADTLYTLVATGAAGTTPATATVSVTVTANPPPPPPPGNLPAPPAQPATLSTPHDTISNFGQNPTHWPTKTPMVWSDASGWNTGALPGDGAVVAVQDGAELSYDVISDARLNVVSVLPGGRLSFTSNTRLRATTILFQEGGALELGTDETPLEGIEIIINNVPFDAADPGQYGHGLVGLGAFMACGTPLTSGPIRLAVAPRAGDTALALATPVAGWRAGDKLLVPDSRQLKNGEGPHNDGGQWYQPRTELVTLGSISADGLNVSLTAPMAFDHPPAKDPDGTVKFNPHVANLTRRIVIRSENAAGVRGHCFFTHMAMVDACHLEVRDCGRSLNDPWSATNIKGRYGVHFHHCMGVQTWTDGAIYNSTYPAPQRWGMTIHNTHFSDFSRNVIDNWAGAGLVGGEIANETQNTIDGNFVVRVRGTNGREDDRGNSDTGHTGAGFWSRSCDNFVRNNVVADCESGYVFWPDGLDTVVYPDGTTVDPKSVPLRAFVNNECYGGALQVAMSIWSVGTAGYAIYPDARESVVLGWKSWHAYSRHYYSYKTNKLTFDGAIIRGDASGLLPNTNYAIGWYAGDYATYDTKLINCDVRGLRTGYACGSMGAQLIQDSFFENFINIVVTPMYWLNSADLLPPRTFTMRNVQHRTLPGSDFWMGPQAEIVMLGQQMGTCNTLVTPDIVYSYAHNGDQALNLRVYYAEQRPDRVLEQTHVKSDGVVDLWACPVAGLTNAQAWAQYGVAFAGAVLPLAAVTRPGIVGFVTS